jgi:hypothetical protein
MCSSPRLDELAWIWVLQDDFPEYIGGRYPIKGTSKLVYLSELLATWNPTLLDTKRCAEMWEESHIFEEEDDGETQKSTEEDCVETTQPAEEEALAPSPAPASQETEKPAPGILFGDFDSVITVDLSCVGLVRPADADSVLGLNQTRGFSCEGDLCIEIHRKGDISPTCIESFFSNRRATPMPARVKPPMQCKDLQEYLHRPKRHRREVMSLAWRPRKGYAYIEMEGLDPFDHDSGYGSSSTDPAPWPDITDHW